LKKNGACRMQGGNQEKEPGKEEVWMWFGRWGREGREKIQEATDLGWSGGYKMKDVLDRVKQAWAK